VQVALPCLSHRDGFTAQDFVRPHAITVDHDDNLWLVDDDANCITKYVHYLPLQCHVTSTGSDTGGAGVTAMGHAR
jgi:hypothetical protein